MNASLFKFLLVTLLLAGGICAGIYSRFGRQTAGNRGTSMEQEDQFLANVSQADSLHQQLKKTDPAEKPSEFSALRFKQEEAIGSMEKGYGADSMFRLLTQITGRNYNKMLGIVALQASDRQTQADVKQQLTDQIATLKTDIQSLENQLMLKQSSLESMRAIKAAQQ